MRWIPDSNASMNARPVNRYWPFSVSRVQVVLASPTTELHRIVWRCIGTNVNPPGIEQFDCYRSQVSGQLGANNTDQLTP